MSISFFSIQNLFNNKVISGVNFCSPSCPWASCALELQALGSCVGFGAAVRGSRGLGEMRAHLWALAVRVPPPLGDACPCLRMPPGSAAPAQRRPFSLGPSRARTWSLSSHSRRGFALLARGSSSRSPGKGAGGPGCAAQEQRLQHRLADGGPVGPASTLQGWAPAQVEVLALALPAPDPSVFAVTDGDSRDDALHCTRSGKTGPV